MFYCEDVVYKICGRVRLYCVPDIIGRIQFEVGLRSVVSAVEIQFQVGKCKPTFTAHFTNSSIGTKLLLL